MRRPQRQIIFLFLLHIFFCVLYLFLLKNFKYEKNYCKVFRIMSNLNKDQQNLEEKMKKHPVLTFADIIRALKEHPEWLE